MCDLSQLFVYLIDFLFFFFFLVSGTMEASPPQEMHARTLHYGSVAKMEDLAHRFQCLQQDGRAGGPS